MLKKEAESPSEPDGKETDLASAAVSRHCVENGKRRPGVEFSSTLVVKTPSSLESDN